MTSRVQLQTLVAVTLLKEVFLQQLQQEYHEKETRDLGQMSMVLSESFFQLKIYASQ
jgi:hypothetical protein